MGFLLNRDFWGRQRGMQMLRTDFWIYMVKLILVSLGVYLSFRFLLPLTLPFLCAYLVIYLLTPFMDYVRSKNKLPYALTDYGIVVIALAALLSLFGLLFWKVAGQLRLLFSNFPVYRQLLSKLCYSRYHSFCKCMDKYFGFDMGTTTDFLKNQFDALGEKYHLMLSERAGKTLLNCLSSSIQCLAFFGFFLVALFILVKELRPLRESVRKSKHYPSFHLIYKRMKKSGFTYLKTECMILCLNWILCSFGIFLVHNPYFFLIGMVIAILDALPILGSGLFLIPWSIFSLLQGEYAAAAILFATFLVTLFVREILEAKLLGKGMGINPFIMLLSIYVGMQLFGAAGIILGPLGSVLIQTFTTE